ncbi:MAG TPA: hypothetical protein VGJ52_06595 [Vicinamibacterales bacterium]
MRGIDSRIVTHTEWRAMTMLDLTPEQRQLLFDKLPDAANVLLGALVVGPFLGNGPFSVMRVLAGLALWLFAFGLCLFLGGRRR